MSKSATITHLPVLADFRALAAREGAKATDPTATQRQQRRRKKQKTAPAVTLPVLPPVTQVATVTATPPQKPNDIKPDVTVPTGGRHGDAAPRRASWSLTALAYGFAALGIGINVWNAMGGNIADTALPAAMGVLAEGVVFFLPARLVTLPAARRALGIALLVFVSAFALTNSLRMASIVAADTAATRADRQTDGTRAADAALDAARKARDDACGRGQGKTVACKTRVDEVGKLEAAKAAAVNRVADQAKPEATDFAGLVAWVSRGTVEPGTKDFDMLWLLFRTFLPQIGGIVLMLAKR